MSEKRVHLPQELIVEILLRLPVKTVLRCMCACKSWLSFISNPDFATSHFQLAASPTHRFVFLESYPCKILSIDFDASLNPDSSYASLNFDFLRRGYAEIGGSCRGFLFLHNSTDFYLWNPSTGVHKQIPASPMTIHGNSMLMCDFSMFMYGFGYNALRDDYLVFLGYYLHNDSSSIDLEIFSLRDNKWKQIGGDSLFPYASCGHRFKVGLFLNGALYWYVYNHQISKDVIIAFDLKEMAITEIPLPDEFYNPIEHNLVVFGGLIGVWFTETDTFNLWVMQEYEGHLSWIKTLVFSILPAPCFFPVCFTSCGNIVGTNEFSRLVKFNDKGQLLEHHSDHTCCSYRSEMIVYTESLLSLPGGTEQA
ncbi:F-box protein CPR1-like [Vicia villosa]|uniref:F-box protein CPR1-like n=1 Tax=Vicia villosa TaxID=3911 RepID=UPI00273B5A12|nr:F-box protein CPR1-like [Vicia villosa]